MRLILAATLTLLLLAPEYAFAVCLKAESKTLVEGILSEGTFKDANDTPEQAFILTPLIPTCLLGDPELNESEQVSTIHIYSSDDAVAQTLKSFLGKDVFVQGTPFAAHTAHHHAPIVMDVTGIQIN
jgi:hypothetical protein